MHVEPQRRTRLLLAGLLASIWGASLHAQQRGSGFEVLWETDVKG